MPKKPNPGDIDTTVPMLSDIMSREDFRVVFAEKIKAAHKKLKEDREKKRKEKSKGKP